MCIILEKCKCPETLQVVAHPSLLDEHHGVGSLAELIESLIIDACGICKRYENGGRTKIIRTLAEGTDITFPIIRYLDGAESTTGSRFVTVIDVPGLAVIQRKPEKQLGFYEKVIGSSVVNSWPIFAISGAMTLAAGLLIWILVRKLNIYFGIQRVWGMNSHVKGVEYSSSRLEVYARNYEFCYHKGCSGQLIFSSRLLDSTVFMIYVNLIDFFIDKGIR